LIGLPLGFIAFSVGIVGLFVLLDSQETSSLSQSAFGQLWRKAIAQNPFLQAFMLNFGGIGFFYSIHRLREHKKALKEEQERQQQQREQHDALSESENKKTS